MRRGPVAAGGGVAVRGSRRAVGLASEGRGESCRPATARPPLTSAASLRLIPAAHLSPWLLAFARVRGPWPSGVARRRRALDDCEESPHSTLWASESSDTASVGRLRLIGPVESCPDGTAGVVAVDPPFVGNGTDDIQAVVPGRVDHSLVPGAAVVLDFDPRVQLRLTMARMVKVPPGRRERLCWAALAASSEAHRITSSALGQSSRTARRSARTVRMCLVPPG